MSVASSTKLLFPSYEEMIKYFENHEDINNPYLKKMDIIEIVARTYANKTEEISSLHFSINSIINNHPYVAYSSECGNNMMLFLFSNAITSALIDCASVSQQTHS